MSKLAQLGSKCHWKKPRLWDGIKKIVLEHYFRAMIHGANEPSYPCLIPLHSSVWHPIRKRDLLIAILRRIRVPKKPFPSKSLQTSAFVQENQSDQMKWKYFTVPNWPTSWVKAVNSAHLLGIREVPWNSRIKTLLPQSPNSSIHCPFMWDVCLIGVKKNKMPISYFIAF